MVSLIKLADFPVRDDNYFRANYRIGINHSKKLAYNLFSVKIKETLEKRMARVICKVNIQNHLLELSITTEVTILTKLDNPALGIVYDYYQDSQNYYIILNSYKTNLQSHLSTTDNHSEAHCAAYMRQVFYFLNYLHSQNIAYRALSLESVYFNTTAEEGLLKIVDFYYSRFLRPGETYGDRVGFPHYIAPEVLAKRGACYSDMWSAGVFLYIILSGKPPFNAKSEGLLNSAIRAGRLEFKEPVWARVSDAAKDLVRRLLKARYEERITSAEALAHPWIVEKAGEMPTVEIAAPFVVNLANFHTQAFIKRKIFRYISYYFSFIEEQYEILKIFDYLDSDKNGKICKIELIEGFSKLFGNKIKTKHIDDILREVDLNNSGDINYKEFIMASIGKQKLLTKAKLLRVFSMIDKNHDGFIDPGELHDALSAYEENNEAPDFWQISFNQIDRNGDGNISIAEFTDFMLKK